MKPSLFCVLMCATAISAVANGAPRLEPARGGMLPNGLNSDQQSWINLVKVAAPVGPAQLEFETWASDPDIYTFTPKWPTKEDAARKRLQGSALGRALHPKSTEAIDGPCDKVKDAVAGNFPVAGSSPAPAPMTLTGLQPCFAEEVRRNLPSFHYIVDNGLNTQPGLAAAFVKAKSKTGPAWKVDMPKDSLEVKADWLPLPTLVDWLAANKVKLTVDQIRKQYLVRTSDKVEYALVSLHLSSKEIPNWVWASFEHDQNPGRCDTMGCFDAFGAKVAAIAPKKVENTQYGSCVKSPALAKMFADGKLDAVWNHYCLKSSQIAYVSAKGDNLILGDSFTERISAGVPINKSSCMACHAAASVFSNGKPNFPLLGTNPVGTVTLGDDVMAVDFIWGILFAPAAPTPPATAAK